MSDGSVWFAGNLTGDPELRYTSSGEPVVRFSVAVTRRRYDRQAAQWVDADTTYYPCSLWGKEAENVAESLNKGQRVIVAGVMETNRWVNRDGENRSRIEVRASDVGPSLKYGTTMFTKSAGGPVSSMQEDDNAPF